MPDFPAYRWYRVRLLGLLTRLGQIGWRQRGFRMRLKDVRTHGKSRMQSFRMFWSARGTVSNYRSYHASSVPGPAYVIYLRFL